MARFTDKVAIVTGGGSGIGSATAVLLAEEIAAVAYLASDDAAFVTGEILRVGGGFTAHTPTHATDRHPEA